MPMGGSKGRSDGDGRALRISLCNRCARSCHPRVSSRCCSHSTSSSAKRRRHSSSSRLSLRHFFALFSRLRRRNWTTTRTGDLKWIAPFVHDVFTVALLRKGLVSHYQAKLAQQFFNLPTTPSCPKSWDNQQPTLRLSSLSPVPCPLFPIPFIPFLRRRSRC